MVAMRPVRDKVLAARQPFGEQSGEAADAGRRRGDRGDDCGLTVHDGKGTEVAVSSTMTVNPEGLTNIYTNH